MLDYRRRIRSSRLSPFGPAIPALGKVFQSDDVEWVNRHCVSAIIGNDYRPLSQEKEIGMGHGILVPA